MIDIYLLIYLANRYVIRFLDKYRPQIASVVYELGKSAYTGAFVSVVLDGLSVRVVILLLSGIALSLTSVKFRD